MNIDVTTRDDGVHIDARAARLRIAPNVLEALQRYIKDAKVLADDGELMRYGDGRPVILDVVAAFHIVCDAEDRARLDASAQPRSGFAPTNVGYSAESRENLPRAPEGGTGESSTLEQRRAKAEGAA